MEIKCETKLACPLCKNEELDGVFAADDYVSADTFFVYRCRQCDLGITEFNFKLKKLWDYYGPSYYGNRKSLIENVINYFRVRLMIRVMGSAEPHSLLDVGCGNGSFLVRIRNIGWSAIGTELAPPNHLNGTVKKFIYKGDLINNHIAAESIDVVTMWHSLEHFIDPVSYISEIRRILKHGGLLVLEVPNFLSWQSKFFRTNWFHLDVPRHLLHFSPRSIYYLLEQAGFKNIQVTHGDYIYEFFGYLQSILNYFNRRKNLLFEILTNKMDLNTALRYHLGDCIIDAIILVPSLVLSCVLLFLGILCSRSGIIMVTAKK